MKVSAYVPCYNNESTLAEVLQSIIDQSLPVDELFVLDDASTDRSAEVARKMGVTVHRMPRNSGRGAVRARAMQEATHEFVLACDATNVLPKTFLEQALPWMKDASVAAVFGVLTQRPMPGVAARWRGRHLFKEAETPQAIEYRALLATTASLVRSAAVASCGGYDPGLRATEDADLGRRLLDAGYQVVKDPALIAMSIVRESVWRVLERYSRWNTHQPVSWSDYVRQVGYSLKVMARKDLAWGDPLGALLSLLSPHHQFFWSHFVGRIRDASAPGVGIPLPSAAGITDVTIVIPTCNRPFRLAHCIRRLPPDAVIVVTDDSPNSRTRDLLDAEFPNVRWVEGPHRGPAANRNNGAAQATTEWIAFLDDDVEPEPGWLQALGNGRDGVDVVEGKTICPTKTHHPLEERVENLTGDLFWSCNLAIRRTAFEQLGRFDEDFTEPAGEDMEFAWRIKHRGLRTRFEPGMAVFHPSRLMNFDRLLLRTRMSRWYILYLLKTSNPPCPLLATAIDLIRNTVRLPRKLNGDNWPRELFHFFWNWLTAPYTFPYMALWEVRYRRMLAGRGDRRDKIE